MKKLFFTCSLLVIAFNVIAQPTFKVGWNTYKTGLIIRQFTYRYTYTDSTILTLIDTATILATADSLTCVTMHVPMRERSLYKSASYLNPKKQPTRTEEYKDEALLSCKDYRYDDKTRKIQLVEENKVTGNTYKKNYDYSPDKKTNDIVVTESAYYNGKIEFYTKSYYDKKSVKYKEVRLNDNNKDVIHIESYTYGDNGKVKERSVFFPEFKVTKHFNEHEGELPAKCFRTMPLGTLEKPGIGNRISFIKKVLMKNQAIIYDKDCDNFEYRFTNNSTCEVVVSTTKTPNVWQVVYRFKERLP
ncbi:MAG: hypothetical protein JWQ38_533 [Flavipsychrobacter sp.]|nr:hypothetical protein [Flavipsychrobacter sp.]